MLRRLKTKHFSHNGLSFTQDDKKSRQLTFSNIKCLLLCKINYCNMLPAL